MKVLAETLTDEDRVSHQSNVSMRKMKFGR